MNITNANGNALGTTNAPGVQAANDAPAARRPSSAPPPPAPAVTSKISSRGELMAKLADLAQKDPAKLKEVLSTIASGLKTAASADEGNGGLAKLAERFSQAAQSGDLSTLTPPQPQPGAGGPHRHHHHHHDGGGESAHAAAQSVFADALGAIDKALNAPAPVTAEPAASAPA
ncbi:MAG: hypothetical protein ABUL60_14265 [Myxococcales bacterium]